MLTTTSIAQDAFLRRFNHSLNNHIYDPDLSVHKLLRLVGMSRTDLHRKLDRSAGMSATGYIRHLRLQRAAALLQAHPDWSIQQVALEVGFSSQSYFTKRFREMFGVCPHSLRVAQG